MLANILKVMAQNKHTSAAAIVGFFTQAVPIFLPEYQAKCDALFKLAMIYGFARAGDAPLAGGDTPPKPSKRLPCLLLCGLLALAAFDLTGCAASRQYATTKTTALDPATGIETTTETTARSSVVATGDAKNIIDKVRASAGKTSTVGASGTDQQTTSPNFATNAAALLEVIKAIK